MMRSHPYSRLTIPLSTGIYTCVFLQTMWIVCVSHREKYQSRIGRKIMLTVIVSLYFLGTISAAVNWAFTRYSFITHGQNFWTIYMASYNISAVKQQTSTFIIVENVIIQLAGGLQNIIADTAIIWRCWIVWDSYWPIIVVPILCTIGGTIAKAFEAYIQIKTLLNANDPVGFVASSAIDWTMVYLYRIVTVGRANRDTALGGYRAVIEIVVESAALFSIVMVLEIATYARGSYAAIYLDIVAASIRGIAPTLIVGRVASGHSRPDDTWKESALSSLHFGARNHSQTQASTQYSDQRDTTSRLQDGNAQLEESKSATEDV
ncbi:hypothetical protein F5146DRAFT_1125896 [Armillaria mellea]|nr:hypothetical protein F5146DRAFT_1125896 [Armillaria mellea]